MAALIPFSATTYSDRRSNFMKLVVTGKYLFIGNEEVGMNYKDNVYPFRQDSTLLYYFGINQPGYHAIIDADAGESIIFGDEIGIDTIIWTGPQVSLKEQAYRVGVSKLYRIAELVKYCSPSTNYLPPYRGDHFTLLHELTGHPVQSISSNSSVIMIKAVVAQRSIKEAQEVVEIEKAVNASIYMHKAVGEAIRPGIKEVDLVGVASKAAYEKGCTWSFNPISTINGQTLHNHYYGNTLKNGDMLLFDGGCQTESCYAGDITRTWSVGGKFTAEQQDLYDIVVASHKHGVNLLKPGMRYLDIYLESSRILFEGLTSLGITKGNSHDAVAAGAHTLFFQCGLGHMMGLDVHDMENLGEQYVGYSENLIKSKEFGLKSLRLGRELEAGFVLTVEPGIYIIPELIDLRKSQGAYLEFVNYDKLNSIRNFGGIRVEEDFVITEDGYRLLGDASLRI